MVINFLIILGVIVILGECYICCLWILAYWRTKKRTYPRYTPVACIIIPCKGIEHGFHENIHAFLTQNYSRYELIFVVDSVADLAYDVLHHHIIEKPNVHLVVTTPTSGCSGKVAALLTGLESVSADAEVLVFADSDIKPDSYWLENIIRPLQDQTIGAITGYRWYFPSTLASVLVSAWNMSSIVFMFFPRFTFAWGGSTAIRKNVFDDLKIKEKWKDALSDDLVLTLAVKKAGYHIELQPKCILESPPETDIRRFIHWGTRQYTWVRWYYPLFWLCSFFGFIGVQVLIGMGILLLLLGYYLSGVLLCGILLFEIVYGWLGITILPKMMIYPEDRYHSKLTYGLLMPIVFLLLAQNVLASALTHEVYWTGRSYRKP